MGIQGLLPLLKSIQKPCHLKKFAGQTIAVDAYGWLHRGTVACAMELATNKPTKKFVEFTMHRVRMLQHFGVIPFLIFDGDYLPSKAATEAERAKKREDSKKHGLELINAGKVSQAYLELQKSIDVTPEMARQLIDELKKTGVQYLVAPYEADAQMVYLERKGLVSGIISEDSDLLVFGAKCLLTKLDQYGNCIEINKADFCACREINLTGWSDTEFRRMAILSGCDYLNSITNMGLKTAYRMVRKYKTIEKVIRILQFYGKYHVPEGYLEAFYRAEFTFLHQRVYCPISNTLVFHTEPDQPIEGQEMPYIGAYVEPEVARRVATGELNPVTKQPILIRDNHTMAAPRTPWLATRQQPRRAVASDDLEKGVSIKQFFKPRRIPLAELDPNCFTPSPTQQNALLRNNGPWTAEPAHRPYLHRLNTESGPQLPQSAPTAAAAGRTLPWTSAVSQPRPSKRGRLCSEDAILDLPGESQKVNIGRSRFFDSPAADPSPSLGRSTRAKRSKQEDITIFSDDSIEEALLSLPDYDGWQKSKPKNCKTITIFEEEEVKLQSNDMPSKVPTTSDDTSQSNTITDVSQTSAPSLTQSSSIESLADDLPTPAKDAITAFSYLKAKFEFTPIATSSLRQSVHSLAAPPSSTKPSRIPLAVKPQSSAVSSAHSWPRISTPLQRLGAKALNNSSALPPTPPYTPVSTSSAHKKTTFKRDQSLLKLSSSCGVPFPEVARPAMLKLPLEVDPAEIQLPISDPEEASLLSLNVEDVVSAQIVAAVVGKGEGKGSEDLIVHDSEEELEDDAGETGEDVVGVTKLDLGRFAFQR